ncbi:Retrovirus-related Pol polyprotein from transposon TNT 1-94 [Gossypium australe]|uniref:Retrovirus-related Pol polyprotein from transposon TNT 1-94 n=1 Tax=Gossypium australe TaxID=47621 RepID=A0A5B6VM53_9ROSI|nr:Retrovirus-related Pol polyprotein from transposon TNT 1-94 [Gossypium australe]
MQQLSDYVKKDVNAPRAWFDKLKAFLVSIGFALSKSDAFLFVWVADTCRMYVLVYVDDIIIIGNSNIEIDGFVSRLIIEFSLKDMKLLHYFLGIEVVHFNSGGLHLS